MNKRTHPSITERRCECRYLEDAANDPDSPILFDETTGEYQFQYDERRRSRLQHLLRAVWGDDGPCAALIIYHCPFCGGAAPESKRHLLFETISCAEESRLAKLLKDIKSIDDAIRQFGEPDFDGHSGTKAPESESNPPKIEHYRDIRYHGLSDVADVWIAERPDGSAFWQLQGKPRANLNDT